MNGLFLELVVKYIHFASIFAIILALGGELFLLKPELTRQEIRRIARIDGIYGVASIALVAAGLSLWFWVGKPSDYYNTNWIFHLKWTLFVVVGILSIIPTVFYMKQRKGDPDEVIPIPKKIKTVVQVELFILFTLPILASAMAKGIGLI